MWVSRTSCMMPASAIGSSAPCGFSDTLDCFAALAMTVAVPDCASAFPVERFQLSDQPLDHAQPALPECRIARVEPERLEQFRVMPGAAGGQHCEIALGEAFVRLLVDRIERVHQAIAERVGVNVERRMDE